MLVLGLLLLTCTAAYQTSAQNRLLQVGDSGVVTLGPNQSLRVTVASSDITGDENLVIRFRQIKYNKCQTQKLCVAGQSMSDPIILASTESADGETDGADFLAYRTVVMSNRRNVKVTGIVFDTSTQRVVSQIIMANTEGDFH